jgi:exodeoxyribonuclease VII small subunit
MAKSASISSSAPVSAVVAPPADSAANSAPLPATYEDALNELEALLEGIETGQLPLDALLGSYQRGAQLLAFCRSKLEAVENQIKVLDGGELKPWRAR